MRLYTDEAALARYLGVTLTAAQTAAAVAAAEAATEWIDAYLGRTWRNGEAVTAEQHYPLDGVVWLRQPPVSAITSVTKRDVTIGASSTTLAANSGYELLDATAGVLHVNAADGQLVRVTYTGTTVPRGVELAATVLAAGWLGAQLQSGSLGGTVEEYAIGRNDLRVKFRDWAASGGVPPTVAPLLQQWRGLVLA